ncbi:MAG TPA: ABC transporter permease [Solirubrobacteraceae bacterium]
MSGAVATGSAVGAPAWLTARRVGWVGVALGVLAFFVAVPPLTVRSPVPVAVLAALSVTCGALAVRGGDKRVGWGAVAAGLGGLAGGIAATESGKANLEAVVVWSALLAATLRYATPLLFGALGGLFSERSGVINIALEGMMLMGAYFGAWGADITGSWIGGIVIGVASGVVLALIHALFAVSFRADQIVSGTALNFLAIGITGYAYVDTYGNQGTPDNLAAIPDVHLGGIPLVGGVFGQLNLMVWIALLLVPAVWAIVFRTSWGLRLRSVGENPRAAETAGLSPVKIRYRAVMVSGGLAAAGGVYLSIGFVHSFTQNMTAGRGFIALAALIFGRWRPVGAFAATLLFGFGSALAQRLPTFSASGAVLFQALPYVLTLIAVAGLIGRSIPPAAIGRPLERS